MANDPKEIKKLLKEIEDIYKRLGERNPWKGTKEAAVDINKLKEDLKEAKDYLDLMGDKSSDLVSSFRAINDEISSSNKLYNVGNKSLSSLTSISEKLRDSQQRISTLSSSQIKKLQDKLKSEKANLEEIRRQLSRKVELNEISEKERALLENVNGLLNEQDSSLQSLNSSLQEEYQTRKKIEGSLGITGGLLKGISKIPIFGNVIDANSALEASEETIRDGGSAVKGLGAAFKNLGGQIKEGVLNPSNLVLGVFTFLGKAIKITDEGAGNLAKSFNITYSEALNVRRELGNIAATSMDAALNTKNLQETLTFVGAQLGSNAKLNEADLKTFTKLREQAGYTNEELYGIQQLSLINNKSLEQNTKEILGGARAYASRNKLVINEKDILRDVSKASASLKLTLGGSAEAVAEAAVKARQFGLNLEQAEKISQSLLNFESSIENELSAELLLGKDLNFERARGLALNGDTAAAAAEIAKQVGTSADFAKMNVIQQEAIAKAAGMERNELAQSLMDREALAKLSAKEGENAQQAFNRLVQEVGMEEAKKRLGNDQLANQFQQQSVQERFNQTVEKLQDIFVQVAEPILSIVSPLMDLVTSILPGINLILQPIVGAFQIIADVVKFLQPAINTIVIGLGAWYATSLLISGAKKTMALYDALSLGYETAKYGISKKDLTLQAARNLAKGEELATQIGIAAAWALANPLTALAGLAIAGAVSAGLYAMMKADDMLSPGGSGGGYGKRTLFGPEGAIQLNDKDTVIAGTDLFKKSDDMVSSPKGTVTVSNKTAPKKETPVDTNAGTNARLDALIAMTGKVNSISTLKIQ